MTKSQFLDQQDMPPTRITSIILNSKNELKIIRPTRFQNHQMQSISIFFKCVHLHLSFVFALLLLFYTFRAVLYIAADPGGPWYLTFALGPLENHTNHMLGTWDFTGSEHWAPFNFF